MDALQDPQMQQFVAAETQRQRFNQIVHSLTDDCWDRCVSYPGNKLDSKTEVCLTSCVERFLDTSNYVVNRLTHQSTTAVSDHDSQEIGSGGDKFLYR